MIWLIKDKKLLDYANHISYIRKSAVHINVLLRLNIRVYIYDT